MLEKDLLARATPERGRFRSFLLTALKNFLANEWKKTHAAKRGGTRPALSLDFEAGDSRYRLEPSHELTPERLYERKWALTLLDRVLGRLRGVRGGRQGGTLRIAAAVHRRKSRGAAYADVAQELGMSAGGAKVAAHRLRKRYRELLRDELGQTVADPAEIDDEINWLFQALS